MGLVFSNAVLDILTVAFAVSWSFYCYYIRNYDYWEKHGVPHVKGRFPFGSYWEILSSRITPGEFFHRLYKRFPQERYFGAYELRRPILVIRDPNLIKQILVADFNHFMDRYPFNVNPRETILHNLFVVDSEAWKPMRHMSSPAFSTGKMKKMFALMLRCSEQLTECLDRLTEKRKVFDIKDVLARFTMDIIATCAFGVEINSLTDKNCKFYKAGLLTFKPRVKLAVNQMILVLFPSLGKLLNIHLVERENKDMFTHLISEAVHFREGNNYSRSDFLDILIKIKNNQSILNGTEEEDGIKIDSKLNDKDETLRMYPSLFMLVRRCTSTHRIPGSDLELEKGQKIYIPSVAIHHDPQYYPDPYKFDPERFTPENVKARHPYVHLPFGTGPRNCIGKRFGLMQTKIGLATLFSRFRVDVAPETPIPMELTIVSIVTQPKKPVYLKVTKRC